MSSTRLTSIEVENLFGLFDHRITLRNDPRITIIHAPNGYGKTAILRMIQGLFGGSLLVFRQYEFSMVRFHFSDGRAIRIDQVEVDANADRNARQRLGKTLRHYTIALEQDGVQSESWSPWDESALGPSERVVLDRFLHRDGDAYRDPRSGERLDIVDAFERYGRYWPRGNVKSPFPEWLSEIRSVFECRLIETQRLMVRQGTRTNRPEDRPDFIPAVRTFSQDISAALKNAIQQSAAITQTLDQSFPNRLLARGTNKIRALAEVPLRARLADLQRQRARLRNAGLLGQDVEDTVSPEKFDVSTRRILTLYAQDAKQKLDVFNELLEKIEAFLRIINQRFQFKKLHLDKDQGFVLRDFRGHSLDPDDLSSGEQHELVLIYELLFKAKSDSLLLIDEPEISLHIAWQKHVLPDLKQIIGLTPLDVILATHSPQLAGGNLNLIETLRAPKNV